MRKFVKAFELAARLHADQYRKLTKIPYISHLMAVSSLVLEAAEYTPFADIREDLAIAALLHDAVEDQGSKISFDDIKLQFGELVAQIVYDCSDSYGGKKAPWRERKEAYIANIGNKCRESQLVSCADKLHNARSIVADGGKVWERFKAPKSEVVWYYESLSQAFAKSWPTNPLIGQLQETVAQFLTNDQA